MTSPSSARILDITEADYFDDKVEDVPTLSYSIASTIVTQSPLHAYHIHPRLGGQKWEPSSAMDAGTVIHALLLEEDPGSKIQLIPFDDFRKKEAQAMRDEVRAAGKTPVPMDKFVELTAAADSIRERLAARKILLDGRREVGITWQADSSRGPVKCRGRLDNLVLEKGRIDEIKTTGDAHPETIIRRIIDQGYDIQQSAYVSAVEKLDPRLAGRVKFRFIFCEIKPPFAVTVAEFDGLFIEHGVRRWNDAVNIWARCLAEKRWPSFADDEVVRLTPPAWRLAKMDGEFDGTIL